MASLATLDVEELERMAAAGRRILDCYRVLRKSGDNIVADMLRDQGTFFEWNHYPKGDVYDPESHAQYYYHAHPANLRGGEHGHFHTFLRPKGMPEGVRPAPVADYEPPKNPDDALSHLIGISMDRKGFPIRLFTTNRWVTGEIWYETGDVLAMVDRFEVDLARPSWPANVWLTEMMRLFRPEIAALVTARDKAVARWIAKHPNVNAYEDRELEITSVMDISVERQIARIDKALAARS